MRLYNTTRGPLAVTLNNGKSMIFRAKHWTEVPADQESSSLLFHYINKGLLHREVVLLKAPTKVLKVVIPKTIEVADTKVIFVKEIKPEIKHEVAAEVVPIVSEVEKLIELPEIPKEVVQSEELIIEEENSSDIEDTTDVEPITKKRKKAKEI